MKRTNVLVVLESLAPGHREVIFSGRAAVSLAGLL